MNRTKIEWVRNPDGTQGYSWNVIKGWCPNNCPYCYSHKMYTRFGWDKIIRFDEKGMKTLKELKKPSKIFVGSMIDMYHPEIPVEWVKKIINLSAFFPQHTFITLTKFPEYLRRFNFPPNWWVGVTIEDDFSLKGVDLDCNNTIAGKKFISFEPLLHDLQNLGFVWADWIIIGGLTPKSVHKTGWIDDIVRRADDCHIPVFIKKNAKYDKVREEFPK